MAKNYIMEIDWEKREVTLILDKSNIVIEILRNGKKCNSYKLESSYIDDEVVAMSVYNFKGCDFIRWMFGLVNVGNIAYLK